MRRTRAMLVATIAAVTLLSYTAPSVCAINGRMESDTPVGTSASHGAAVQSATMTGMCCSVHGCGAVYAGPPQLVLVVPIEHHVDIQGQPHRRDKLLPGFSPLWLPPPRA